jgi:hypothetical protein
MSMMLVDAGAKLVVALLVGPWMAFMKTIVRVAVTTAVNAMVMVCRILLSCL